MHQSELKKPLKLRCGLVLPNRISMAPLTNTQSCLDGRLGYAELKWLVRRAIGGVGWITTCAAYVSDEGKAWSGQLGISNDYQLSGLSKLASSIREKGATCFVQLHHAGARADLAPHFKLSTVDQTNKNVKGAKEYDLKRVINDFVLAAIRAEKAGFNGIEIHGANGYLFTQFLSTKENIRADHYGGVLENRARFLRETMRSIRSAVSKQFAVGVRLSPVDTKRGLILADSIQIAQWLAEDGADFIHLSLSNIFGTTQFGKNKKTIVEAFRESLTSDVIILAAGGIWTFSDAEQAYNLGVDVVALGQAAIAHPDWPKASITKDWQPVRPPWSKNYLKKVSAGSKFIKFLGNSPGWISESGSMPQINENEDF